MLLHDTIAMHHSIDYHWIDVECCHSIDCLDSNVTRDTYVLLTVTIWLKKLSTKSTVFNKKNLSERKGDVLSVEGTDQSMTTRIVPYANGSEEDWFKKNCEGMKSLEFINQIVKDVCYGEMKLLVQNMHIWRAASKQKRLMAAKKINSNMHLVNFL